MKGGKRGVTDFLLQTLGLQSVWNEIQTLGGNFAAQLIAIGAQLLFAGSQSLNNAKAIFAKLVSDLTNHTSDASTLVSQAIGSLNQVLGKYLYFIILSYGFLKLFFFDFRLINFHLMIYYLYFFDFY